MWPAMSDNEEIDGRRRRVLSNGQVLAFVWRQWMRRPRQLALIAMFMAAATACDLAIPWTVRALTDAVASPAHMTAAAWRAWAALAALYVMFYGLRQGGFRLMNPFAARNMEAMTNEAF